MEHLYELGLVEDTKEDGKTYQTLVDEDTEGPLGDYLSEKESVIPSLPYPTTLYQLALRYAQTH